MNVDMNRSFNTPDSKAHFDGHGILNMKWEHIVF